jgi:radical SAM superfamily enzyme YgiQ (UPF0313 family)
MNEATRMDSQNLKTKLPPEIILVRVSDKSMPNFKKIGAVQTPMNLVYLATWLDQHGHIPEIVDLDVESLSHLEEKLRCTPPYLVGITAMTPNIREAERICVLCHSLGVKTVLGGPHPTALPIQTLQDTGCDFVISGEGEKPLCELLRHIKENRPTDHIKGIAFLKNGSPVVNEWYPLIPLDELPLPDRRFLKLDLYRGETTPGVLGRAATLFTSRGCPYACTFCASKVINQQRIRFRSMEKIFEEIDDIVNLGFNHLTVDDDTFTLNSQRVFAFCSFLMSKHPWVSWDCDSRVDAINENLLTIMKGSHCEKIAFGVESGSPRILKSINKGIDLEQVRSAFRLTRKHKILTQAFFMIGFPDETPEDIEATEKLIYEIEPDLLFLAIVVPYPGTDIYEEMIRRGLLTQLNWDSFVFFGESVPWCTEHFNGEDLVKIRKKMFLKFYFRPSYMFRKIRSIRSIREISYFIRGGLAAWRSS